MAAACSPWDGNCLPPSLGEEEESSSGKCLETEADSKAVLSLHDKASCLERLWAGLFKGRADPQPPPSAYASPGWKGKVQSVSKDVLGGGGGGLQQDCCAWQPHTWSLALLLEAGLTYLTPSSQGAVVTAQLKPSINLCGDLGTTVLVLVTCAQLPAPLPLLLSCSSAKIQVCQSRETACSIPVLCGATAPPARRVGRWGLGLDVQHTNKIK